MKRSSISLVSLFPLVLLFAFFGISSFLGDGTFAAEVPVFEPTSANIDSLARILLGGEGNTLLIGENEDLSVRLITVSSRVKSHYHAKHTELVIVTRGKGIMTVGGRKTDISTGSVVLIPRGVAHDAVSLGKEPLLALSIFSPFFDGKDRIPVEE